MRFLIKTVKGFLKEYKENEVILWSAFLTYLTVLNAAPFFYFLVFIASRIPFVKSRIPAIKSTIVDVVPAYSHELLRYIDLFLSNISKLELINALIFSVSMFSLIGAFFGFARRVYPHKKLNILKMFVLLISMLVLTSIVISVLIAAKIVLPLFLPHIANMLYVKLFPLFVWFVVILSVFYLLKDRNTHFKYTLYASVVTTLLIFLLKLSLSVYFSLFTYSKIYGAVAIIPTILLWLFLFWNIILSGVMLPKVFALADSEITGRK